MGERTRPAPMPMLQVQVEKGKRRDWDSYPPSHYVRRGNFFQISFLKKYLPPLGMGPPKKFQTDKSSWGLSFLERFKHFTGPPPLGG